MIKVALARIVTGNDLSMDEAKDVMGEIMQGQATPAQIAAFITGLRMKGETAEEIAGCAQAMMENAIRVKSKHSVVVDTCGTGGDSSGTFNISTTVAFVAAGAGLAVAKHGNRSVSSKCGSADLLQAFGVNLELNAEQVARCIDEVGIGFLFAPLLHPAMKHALGPRQEIGLRTIFNILGPLCNPAGTRRQLLGVYASDLTDLLAEVLRALSAEHALVVHGADGLDELSTTGPNKISQVYNGRIETYYLDPQELGLPRAKLADLAGGTAEDNAATTRAILSGEQGPKRDIVLLNAAAVLMAGGMAQDFGDGLVQAAVAIDSGNARMKLDQLIEFSRSLA
ncbi:MAG: anthranilate phosphoribosyltransferase [Dehalococcoidia bacterium]|nr:MAG: anthranilate phosphoribosyltransferase [Dehalococcoidia bacterium]